MDGFYRNSMANNCSSVKFHILVLGTFSHFLLTTNSSSNFFIYCMMSTEFRDLLKTAIKHRLGTRMERFFFSRKSQKSDSPRIQSQDSDQEELRCIEMDTMGKEHQRSGKSSIIKPQIV